MKRDIIHTHTRMIVFRYKLNAHSKIYIMHFLATVVITFRNTYATLYLHRVCVCLTRLSAKINLLHHFLVSTIVSHAHAREHLCLVLLKWDDARVNDAISSRTHTRIASEKHLSGACVPAKHVTKSSHLANCSYF
jgi:hypothetical protein